MQRGAVLLCLLLLGQPSVFAFRHPDLAGAPLGPYDVRTQVAVSAPAGLRPDVQKGLAQLAGPLPSTVQVRFHPATGRPRNLFSLQGRLSDSSPKSPDAIAKDFLISHQSLFGLTQDEIAEARTADQYLHPDGKTRHLVLQQRCAKLDVFQARVSFAVDEQGRVIQVAGDYYPALKMTGAIRLTALEAIRWAAAYCDRNQPRGGPVLPKASLNPAVLSTEQDADRRTLFAPGSFRDPVSAHLVIMAVGNEGVPAWEMTLHLNSQECYRVLVDASNGSLLYRANLYKFALPAGLVFTENPDAASRQTVSFAGDPFASPAGWCDATSTTQGNNVVAREDFDGDNNTAGLQPFAADQRFIFPFANRWAVQHTTASAALDVTPVVTNVFYFCNWFHDYSYGLGFNEVSGNFQQDNSGRGGQGRDPVYADAMDGYGFNNASFLTLPDGDPSGPYGGHSRLQINLFRPQPPLYPLYRDGDLDGDIVLHELTHGMTARMVGGPSNVLGLDTLQATAMAEGWSDFFPCSIFGDPVVGEYVTGNRTRGARHAAYDAHPWTFGWVGNTFEITTQTLPPGGPFTSLFLPEEHSDGEIWAAALWALRTEIASPRTAEFLVVEALRYTPIHPTMLDGRDAILLADALKFQGMHRAAIWRAFARRGMGWSAETEAGSKATLVFQAFDWPPSLGGSFTTGTVVFSDNMETSRAGWVVRHSPSSAGVAFHVSRHRYASATRSWYFGQEGTWNYDTGSREWSTLETPPIALAAGSGYRLEFKHRRSAEDAIRWDVEPFYFDPAIIYVHPAGTNEYYQVGFAFRNTNGWETRCIDLSRFAGRTIRIGFYFDTWDQYNNAFEGWYIDDVRVVQTRTTNTPPSAARPSWAAYR